MQQYLSDDDKKLVKKLLRSNLVSGVIVLLVCSLIIVLLILSEINGDKRESSFGETLVMIIIIVFLIIFVLKYLILGSIHYLRRVDSGVYVLSHYEIIRCWSERFEVNDKKSYRYYWEAIRLDGESSESINEEITQDAYEIIKGYKYAYGIHFFDADRSDKKLRNGKIIDRSKAGYSYLYKATNEM